MTDYTQPAIACSKLTTETLEQGVKYVQSLHCVKSVRIRSFFGPYYPAFGGAATRGVL